MKLNSFKSTRAFSLVELLLTLVLILCLAAASVFSYTALHRSANLDEGVDRLQSLIRFAQAEAATSGKKVRIQFEPGTAPVPGASSETVELRQIKVTWEADIINEPGVFQEYTNKAWSEDIVNELVGVTKVLSIPLETTIEPKTTPSDDSADLTEEEWLAEEFPEEEFPAITFYPDGSCDSAEIILASRNGEDERRLAVRLSGILGSISSHSVSDETQAVSDLGESTELEESESFEETAPDNFSIFD